MKTRTFLFILAMAGIVFSCIPSLYPLYRQKDLMVNDKLEGIFEAFGEDFSPGDDDYWKIRRLGPDIVKDLEGDWQHYQTGYTYKLSVMEDGEMEEFAMHLLKLGEDLYLDFFPVGYRIKPEFLEMHLAPSHIFARAEISDEYLVLHFFDMDWIEELIDENRIKISHMKLHDNRYLLTAKTGELQRFIAKFANDSTTFMEADTMLRIAPGDLARIQSGCTITNDSPKFIKP